MDSSGEHISLHDEPKETDESNVTRQYFTRGGYLVKGKYAHIPLNEAWPREPLDAKAHKFLPAIGGVAAIASGATYFIGLLSLCAEYFRAGLSPSDVLPLVPLSQILGRGLPTMLWVTMLTGLVTLLLILTDYHSHIPHANRPLGTGEPRSDLSTTDPRLKKVRLIPAWLNLLIATIPALFLSPRTAVIIIPPSYLLGLYETQRLKPRYTMAPYWAALLLTFMLSYGVSSFIWPRSLADVSVTIEKGGNISGKLITTSSDTIYVSNTNGKEQRVTALPKDKVSKIDIIPGRSQEPRSLGEIIHDLVRSP